MTYLLHIDTSGDLGCVAVSGDGALVSHRYTEETRSHASAINTMIEQVLAEAGISFQKLSAIAVCAGPGSYTGLRIGLSTAKGLCYALDLPLILDNKLTLLADAAFKKAPGYDQYISLLVAREREYFVAVYDRSFSCITQPQHVTEDMLSDLLTPDARTYMLSDASQNIVDRLQISQLEIKNDTKIDLNSWAIYSFEKHNCNHIVNLADAEPFYLKQVYTHK